MRERVVGEAPPRALPKIDVFDDDDAGEGAKGAGAAAEGALPRMSRAARALLGVALAGNILMYAAAAVGTVLATLDGLSKWVAVTVGFHHSVSSWMATFRVEERRTACARAVSALERERVAWMALPREMQSRQDNLDKLVSSVEAALEATLPPQPPSQNEK